MKEFEHSIQNLKTMNRVAHAILNPFENLIQPMMDKYIFSHTKNSKLNKNILPTYMKLKFKLNTLNMSS